MSCANFCHNPYCYDDREHFCHDPNCECGRNTCICPLKRTDGLPPCGKAVGHKRPDGWYCDCGHEVECCTKFKRGNSSAPLST